MAEQTIHVDPGDYEAVPLDSFELAQVGIVVKSPYTKRYEDPPSEEDSYAGQPFIMGAKEVIFIGRCYSEIGSLEGWVVRKLRPGEKVIITGG